MIDGRDWLCTEDLSGAKVNILARIPVLVRFDQRCICYRRF